MTEAPDTMKNLPAPLTGTNMLATQASIEQWVVSAGSSMKATQASAEIWAPLTAPVVPSNPRVMVMA